MASGLQCPSCGHVHPSGLPEIARGDSTFRCYGCYRTLSVPDGWTGRPSSRPPVPEPGPVAEGPPGAGTRDARSARLAARRAARAGARQPPVGGASDDATRVVPVQGSDAPPDPHWPADPAGAAGSAGPPGPGAGAAGAAGPAGPGAGAAGASRGGHWSAAGSGGASRGGDRSGAGSGVGSRGGEWSAAGSGGSSSGRDWSGAGSSGASPAPNWPAAGAAGGWAGAAGTAAPGSAGVAGARTTAAGAAGTPVAPRGTAAASAGAPLGWMAPRRSGKPVPTALRALVWAVALGFGLLLTAFVLRTVGLLGVNTAIDLYAGSGARRFGILLVLLPVWALLSATIAHFSLEALAHRQRRQAGTSPMTPARQGPPGADDG